MLLYFILGILFMAFGIPIIQNIVSILSALTEYIVYIFAGKVYAIKRAITEEDQEEYATKKTQIIGFQHSEQLGDQDWEDYDE